MARSVRRNTLVSPRRKRIWARDEAVLDLTGAASAAVELGADFSATLGTTRLPLGSTIGGIRLDLTVVQNGALATPDDGLLLGIIAVNETVAGEVETPGADPHADWMWWQWIPAPGAAAGRRNTWERGTGTIEVRSKRKLEELGTRLWIVGENVGVTTYDVNVYASTLILLP